MVVVRKLIQEAMHLKEPSGRFHRCEVAPRLSATVLAHIEERRGNPRFHFSGKTFKRWVDLDPMLMVNELHHFLSDVDVSTYLVATLGEDVCCVTAELLLTTSAKAPQQSKHRDHTFGYRKYVYLVFDINGRLVDTLIDEDGTLCPANCPALLFDAFTFHAGPAGNSQTKIFLGFSNPRLRCFRRMLHQQRPRAFIPVKHHEWPRLAPPNPGASSPECSPTSPQYSPSPERDPPPDPPPPSQPNGPPGDLLEAALGVAPSVAGRATLPSPVPATPAAACSEELWWPDPMHDHPMHSHLMHNPPVHDNQTYQRQVAHALAELPNLRCLNVRQPWASMLVEGIKSVENRPLKANRPYFERQVPFDATKTGEWVLIVASTVKPTQAVMTVALQDFQKCYGEERGRQNYDAFMSRHNSRWPLGCVVGAVRFDRLITPEMAQAVATRSIAPPPWLYGCDLQWYHGGADVGWHVANGETIALNAPITDIPGVLSIARIALKGDELETRIREALRRL